MKAVDLPPLKSKMLYICQTHGIQDECDVSKSGERICYKCGNAVTGVSITARGSGSPPVDDPQMMHGEIMWIVNSYSETKYVNACGYYEALGKGIELFDDPQSVTEVKPENWQYRH